MILRPCLTCNRLTPNTRCPEHSGGTSWNGTRDRSAQARFRKAVLARDHYACVNCGSREDLRACHIQALHQGGSYDTSNGVTRCGTCDRLTDPHAR